MTIDKPERMNPVHLFSHGSTMMLGEESSSADYWKKCGDEALAHGIEHVIMMGAHWATSSPGILISANPKPSKSPVAYVDPAKYKSYVLTPDLDMVDTIQTHLSSYSIPSTADPTITWIHDTYLILIRMFPTRCPPTTLLSTNHTYDPHFHASIGAALRPLRAARHHTLFIGSGGAVHNLYRNVWGPMYLHRDNFALVSPPQPWALDFRQEFVDVICPGRGQLVSKESVEACDGRPCSPPVVVSVSNTGCAVGGPLLRRKATSLMKHPMYREAHATDDHFMAALFVAGLCGGEGDEGMTAELGAEDWELTNMCNSQFTLGSYSE